MAGLNLSNLGWRTDSVRAVADALGADRGQTRLVGGAVRDSLAGLPVKDVDLATCFAPDEVIHRLGAAGIKTVATGLAHGTVTAIVDSGGVEITTLRRDLETDGRRAKIAFSDDWREDAARRDFTINALYADILTGEVFDYFGGAEDLRAGMVRFIGDPLKRIAEDHLRILRFFRFHARFGRGRPDTKSLDACGARANDLMALSRERIADELLKLLALPDPAPTIALMIERRVFAPILPEITSAKLLERLVGRERVCAIPGDPVRRLAAILPAEPERVRAVAARLKLSKRARKRLDSLAQRETQDVGEPRALAYWFGLEVAVDLLLLGDGDAAALDGWHPPTFPISGKDVIANGVVAGPQVADLLRKVEQHWVAEDFPALGRLGQILEEVVGKER